MVGNRLWCTQSAEAFMDESQEMQVVFGYSEEWKMFMERHPKFLDVFRRFNCTMRKVLIRTFEVDSGAKEIIHFLGRLTIEDFMEVLMLSANGYGVGALKILRGQYERTVTAGYLSKHPEEADKFAEFGNVQYHKMLNQARQIYSVADLRAQMSPGKTEEIEEAYRDVKDKFVEPLCRKCGTTRPSFSWSSLDTASMALKSGYGLEKLYLHAYMIPTQQAHATVVSLLSRVRRRPDGEKYFDESAQHEEADAALSTSHTCMLVMLGIQDDFHQLGLKEEINQRCADYGELWKRPVAE
jgi:hypothetical protein